MIAPPFRPPHATAYQTREVPFTAPCPVCQQDCPWVATAAGEVSHCPCEQEAAA